MTSSEPCSKQSNYDSGVAYLVEAVPNLPWFGQDVTQVQYLVKNTDVQERVFVLNFLFYNGINSETKIETVKLLPS